MGRYNEQFKNYSIAYERENLKRIPLNVQKSYYEDVLKPAADAAGEPVNTYIKKAIEMRMKADSAQEPKKWYLLEDCTRSRAQVYHTELKSADKEGALREAVAIWNSLTDYDKSQREAVYIFRSRLDEYGDPDFDQSTDFTDVIEASQS